MASASATSSQLFQGKVALVTGSTTGIGRGIAHTLAGHGCSVLLSGLEPGEDMQGYLNDFKQKYKGTFQYIQADFSTTDGITAFNQCALALHPKGVDILVNNAGVPGRGDLETIELAAWLSCVSINLTAPFMLTQAFFPLMKQKGWGRIINMSSQMGIIADKGRAGYCSTKAGLIGLSKVTALEGAEFGVTCVPICPGFVDAPMMDGYVNKLAAEKNISYDQAKIMFTKERHPSGKLIPIDQITSLVVYLCSDSGASINGSPMVIDCANTIR